MAINSNEATLKIYEHFKTIITNLANSMPEINGKLELLFDTNLKGDIQNPKTYRVFCQRGVISEGKETLSIDVTDTGRERYYNNGYAVISIYAPKHLEKASVVAEELGFYIKRELRRQRLDCIIIQNVTLKRLNMENNCYRFDLYMQVKHSEIY